MGKFAKPCITLFFGIFINLKETYPYEKLCLLAMNKNYSINIICLTR